MKKTHGKPFYDFDAVQGSLLAVIQEAGLPYRWGFPFFLKVTKDGKQVTLCTKDDLPHFLSSLGKDPVDFPDWRGPSDASVIKLPQPWKTTKRRSRKTD